MPCNNHMYKFLFADIDSILILMTCYKFHKNFDLYYDELESIINEMCETYHYNNEIMRILNLYHEYLKTMEKYKWEDKDNTNGNVVSERY